MKQVNQLFLALVIAGSLWSCNSETPLDSRPIIESFSPDHGPIGTTVVITGKNFSENIADSRVTFRGIHAEITNASPTELTVTVPAGASTGRILLESGQGTDATDKDFTVTPPNSPNDPSSEAPLLYSFEPTSGGVGSTVTITGANFSTVPSENIVTIGDTPAQVTSATSTQLTMTVPNAAISGRITVIVRGRSVTSDILYIVIVIPPPAIDNFSPVGGLYGATIFIYGTRFSMASGGNVVKFNDLQAEITEVSSSKLTVRVPPNATSGKIHVTIDGTTVSTATDFIVIFRPVVTAIFPLQGRPGDLITITGEHFLSTAFSDTYLVFFFGKVVLPENISDTEMTVRVPAGASSGQVTIVANLLSVTTTQIFEVLL